MSKKKKKFEQKSSAKSSNLLKENEKVKVWKIDQTHAG